MAFFRRKKRNGARIGKGSYRCGEKRVTWANQYSSGKVTKAFCKRRK